MATKDNVNKIDDVVFRKFLHELGDHLTKKEVRDLKFLSNIPDGKSEKIVSGLDLLAALEKHNVISEKDEGLESLCELLEAIHRRDLVAKVTAYRKRNLVAIATSQHPTIQSISGNKGTAPQSLENENMVKLKPPSSFVKTTSPPSFKTAKLVNNQPVFNAEKNLCAKIEKNENAAVISNNFNAKISNSPSNENGEPKDLSIPSQKLTYALDKSDNNEYYEMKKAPKGICLILSNEEFDDKDNRKGSEIDVRNIEETFDNLGFNVRIHKNARVSQEMKDEPDFLSIFKNCAQEDHTNYSCFVAFILSHGCEDGIYGVDGRTIDINSIIDPFKVCISLSGKPKIFFGQFCQGDSEEKIYVDYPGAVNSFSRRYHPKEADFYIGYATPPGYVAYRSETRGSWFISKLCKIFKAYAREEDLSKMMTKVCGEMNKAFTSTNCKQVVQIVTTLTKELRF